MEYVNKAQYRPLPGGWKDLPGPARQEKGTRPSTALPYSLTVDGVAREGGLVLTLAAGKGAGSGFHAYTPGLYKGSSRLRTRAYAVAAGSSLQDVWELAGFPDGKYDVRVHGPNGFYREFVGSAFDPALDVRVGYVDGDLELRIIGHAGAAMVLTDESYGSGRRVLKVDSSLKLRLGLKRSQRWYDFSVVMGGFRRRFAGRVEDGSIGVSDPAMA